ncbi:hypothetical protein ABMB44_14120 [Levilactobacillus brevis]
MFQPKEPTLTSEQFKQLQAIAENMQWNGKFSNSITISFDMTS